MLQFALRYHRHSYSPSSFQSPMVPWPHTLVEYWRLVEEGQEEVEAAIHIDSLNDLFATIARMCAIFELTGIVVVMMMVIHNIVTVIDDSLHIAMPVAAEVLHDLIYLNIDDGVVDVDVSVVWFAVLDDTFHFDYLMAVYSALLILVAEIVLVQRDLDYSIANFEDGPADTVLWC